MNDFGRFCYCTIFLEDTNVSHTFCFNFYHKEILCPFRGMVYMFVCKKAVINMIQSTMSYNNSKRKKMEMVVKWRKKEFSFIFSFGKLYCCCCCWCLYLRISFEFELMMMLLLLLLFAFFASLKRFRDIYFARNMNLPVQKIHIIYKSEEKMHTFHPYKYEEKNKQTNECHQHEQL